MHRDRSHYRYPMKSNMPAQQHSVWNMDFPSFNNNEDVNGSSNNNVHAKYMAEIEKLGRKLQQRDETLKRVLQAKSK